MRPVSGAARRVHWGGVCGRGGGVGEPGVVERHYRSLFKDGLFLDGVRLKIVHDVFSEKSSVGLWDPPLPPAPARSRSPVWVPTCLV